MPHAFTLDDVLLFLYEEMDPQTKASFSKALQHDTDLEAIYQKCLALHHRLDQEWRHPSQSSVDIIMGYSNSLSSLKAH